MKKIAFLTILGAITLVSCKKYFGDVNTDPNNPIEVTPAAVLPGIEAKLSYALAGDGSRFSTLLTQQIDVYLDNGRSCKTIILLVRT